MNNKCRIYFIVSGNQIKVSSTFCLEKYLSIKDNLSFEDQQLTMNLSFTIQDTLLMEFVFLLCVNDKVRYLMLRYWTHFQTQEAFINKYLESKFDDCKSIDCSLQLNKSWQCIASRYLVLVGTLGSTRDADSWDWSCCV